MLSSATAGGAPAGGIRPSTSPVSPMAMTLRCERVCLFIVQPSCFVVKPLNSSPLDHLAARRLRREPMARGVPRPLMVKIEEIQGLRARSYCAALLNGGRAAGQCAPVDEPQ